MQFLKKLQWLASGRQNRIMATVAAVCATALVYISCFQRNFFSKTYLAFTVLVFAGAWLMAAALNRLILEKFRAQKSRQGLRLCFWTALALALLLLLNFEALPLYLLEPDGTVTIRLAGESAPTGEPAKLTYLRNRLGFIPYEELNRSGAPGKDHLSIEEGAVLSLSGDMRDYLEIGFKPEAKSRLVIIEINGEEYQLDLQGKSGGEDIVFRRAGQASLLSRAPFALAFVCLAGYALLVLLALLSSLSIKRAEKPLSVSKIIMLGIPLLVTCGLTLLVFWPGMLTNDSLNQWLEIVSGAYSDLNPLLHTLLLSALVRLVDSPASVAIFQTLVLCALLIYGLNLLNRLGVRPGILAANALIFAIWPFNPLFVNTLWKDVLYSCALLALFIFLVEIALTEGKWLESKWHFLLLYLSAFLVAVFRLNGSPVALLTLAILPLIYKKYRKGLLFGLLALTLTWWLVRGPLQSRFAKSEVSTSALNLTLLHHIAAHLAQGSDFNKEQLGYLDELLPLEYWQYDCCYIGNIYTHPDFDQLRLMRNSDRNLQIASFLFLQNPAVDIQDQLCASEMDWRFLNNQCTFKSLHPFDFDSTRITGWIPDNEFGLRENSILPQLLPVYYALLEKIGAFSGSSTPLLRPAFYVYLTIIALAAAALRLKSQKILIAAVPVLLQTGILALINFAPAFRYQYGICLIGLFCLGLIFLPVQEE